jgi:hypothetical protein
LPPALLHLRSQVLRVLHKGSAHRVRRREPGTTTATPIVMAPADQIIMLQDRDASRASPISAM